MDYISNLLVKNGLIVAFLVTGLVMYLATLVAEKIFFKKIPASAIAIFAGLVLAYIGGRITGHKNGIADIKIFSGFGILGGAMFRDFAIVSTAMGANFHEI